MAIQVLGEYNTTQPTYTTSGQHTKLQSDSRGNMRVVLGSTTPGTAEVLAKATGSDGGLGKVAAMAASETIYTRIDLSDQAYSYVDWLVKTSGKSDVAFYVANSMVDSVDVTLDAIADTNVVDINGLTLTGKANAAAAVAASRYFRVDATGNDADAVVLAALINADYAVTTAGTSIAATDKLTITTDEGAHTIVAGATAVPTTGTYGLSSTVGTELTSIVATINHSQNITCSATVTTALTTTINGYVFTAGSTEAVATRTFDNDAGANATATSLAVCINDATYGVPGVTAIASGAVVYLYRDTEADSITLTSSSAAKLTCVTTVGGVPGVTAVETGATGELTITPTWTKVLTVTESGAQLTVVDIDIPGVLATAGTAKVTLTPGTPAGVAGELASVLQVTGTATRTVISKAVTLAGLIQVDITTGVDLADNSLTAGRLFHQSVYGYPYAYCGLFADGTTPTVSISAIKRI
jgi:hypothetical protein